MRLRATTLLDGLFIGCAAIMLAACDRDDPVARGQLAAFGSSVEITLIGVNRGRADEITRLLADDVMQMEHAWSPVGDSPLTRINQRFNEDTEAFAAPPSVLPILRLSQVLAAKSDDLFNPAIGHLVRAWGLQSQNPSQLGSRNADCVRPVDDELVALVVDARPRMSDIAIDDIRIASRNHLVRLDFRDISQGLAIDRMIGRLKELGIDNASVSIDGKLRAIGSRDGHPWTVTVRGPGGGGVLATLNILGNEAAATVGGQRYLISYQGSTYPDVIDPRTGRPAEHTTSVTVLHENASTADAAATALFVAGPREWHRVAMQMGVRYVMLSDSEGRLHMNPEMQARVKLQGSKREVIVSEPLT
jgi:FAD:protein FMN transferase